MKLRDRDLYDSSSMLSSWENEGGAAVGDTGSRCASDDILHSFGQSVVAHWNELPHGFKQTVFREIASGRKSRDRGLPEESLPEESLKVRAARFLHDISSQLPKRNLERSTFASRNDNEPS